MNKRFCFAMRLRWFWLLIIAAGLFLAVVPLSAQEGTPEVTPAGAQTPTATTPTPPDDVSRLVISRLDAAAFPFLAVDLIVNESAGERVTNLSTLALRENGIPIVDFTIDEAASGLDIIFVVDANADIFNIDDDSGRNRLEKVQDALVRYGTQFMSTAQLDHVSIIVPQGDEAVFLVQDETRPGDLVDTVEAYTLDTAQGTPLQEMMDLALEQAENSAEAGRYQAIVLLTDGATINNQLAFDNLVATAGELGLTYHTLILGARADDNEIENAARLTEPTSGRIDHMPNAPDADELFAILQDNGTQARVTYRSTLADSGDLRLQVNLGEAQDSVESTISLSPPEVAVLPTVTTIRRAGTQPDTPLASLQPAVQPLEAQITWPGGQSVSLADVQILVNGEAVAPVDAPVVSGDEILRLDWDISALDAGTYAVALRLTDALGRTSESDPVAITIEVNRPVPTTDATPVPTPTPLPEAAGVWDRFSEDSSLLFLAGLGGLFLLLLGVLIAIRRRRHRPDPADEEADMLLFEGMDPAQDSPAGDQSYLVVLPNGPEPERPIPLPGDDITIGRDPKLVQIPLADQSISRLHARIRRRKGDYWLYDEGSATGTYLNFNRIGLAPHMLQEGDEVHIGRVHLRFHHTLPSRFQDYFQNQETGEEEDQAA